MKTPAEAFFTPNVFLDFTYSYRVGPYTERYLEGFKDKKILGSRCPGCAKVAVPPRMYCGACNKKMEELLEVSGEGSLENFTVGHVVLEKGAVKPAENPYILGLIKLDGANSLLLAKVEGISAGAVKTGMRMKAAWKDQVDGDYGDLDHFEPA